MGFRRGGGRRRGRGSRKRGKRIPRYFGSRGGIRL